MIEIAATARVFLTPLFRSSFSIPIMLALLVSSAGAQTTTTSATDGATPLGIAPGSPAGSYALSGFDNINPYNGNLNFRLPLLHVGGRGGAQMTMMLALNTKTWHVKHSMHTDPQGGTTESYAPTDITWNGLDVGYGPGVLIGRQTGVGTWSCSSFPKLYVNTLTRLTFKTPDGTEYELRDQATNGQPLAINSCSGTGPSRGTIFISADGTAVTFVSDASIPDNPVPQGDGSFIFPSGSLMLRDGTRYRIDSGLVSWIRDRNGNRLSFTYGTDPNSNDYNRVKTIADSLGRQVTINYKMTDVPPFDSYGKCDQISFRGFGGVQRIIRVFKYNPLDTALRSDYQAPAGLGIQTYKQLFPELDGTGTNYDPKVVTAIYLPDGSLHYQFSYNLYGELARVVLPTGGAFEYDTTGDQPTTTHSGVISTSGDNDFQIYRRVTERRVKPDGTTLEGKMVYTSSYSGPLDPTPWTTTTTINHMAGDQVTLLARDKHYFNGSPINSLFQNVPAYLYPAWNESKEYQIDQFDSNGTTLLTSTADTFQQRIPTGQSAAVLWWNSWATQKNLDVAREPANDPHLTDTVTSLTDIAPNLLAKQHFDYDQYNNKTDVYEYDFGSGTVGSLMRRTHTGYITANVGANYDSDTSIHIRSLPSEQWVSTDSAGITKKARTTYEYDHYNQTTTEDFHAALTDRSNITGLDGSFTTTYYTRGNVTKTTRAVSFDTSGNVASSVSGYAQYDIAGNVVEVIGPRSTPTNIIATTFDFGDRYGIPDDEAESNTVPTELNANPQLSTYAFATKVTNALGQVAYTQYDYYLGKPVNSEDPNGTVSSERYAGYAGYTDPLDRPTELIVAPNVSSLTRRTRITYNDSSHMIITQSDQATLNDGGLTSTILYDGLGRTTDTQQLEPGGGVIHNVQQYDAMGRVSRTYNPYRTTSDGYADTRYDALSRLTTVTTSDSAAVMTSYSGNATTVTDQSGKKRRSVTDGLGRLIRIDEPDSSGNLDNNANPPQPLQPTNYSYDALGNLIQVNQGSQQRLFTYDSLSRLKTAENPEQVNSSGQMVDTTYSYDDASNLMSKTGPNSGASVSFTYDGLNRVKTKTLSSGGMWDYTYDTAAISNAKGRLVSVVLHGGTDGYYFDSYDAMGRVTASRQITTAGTANSYTMSYEYDLAGHMTRQVYPSGKAFITEYDSAGRIAGVKKEAANYYAGASPTDTTNRIQYSAHGAVSAMKFGNQKWEHTLFNSRFQPIEIGLGTSNTDSGLLKLEYKYGVLVNNTLDTTQNNGNVQSQIITAPGLLLTQTYTYDKLNRLNDAIESGGTNEWSQTYSYDRFGNRAVTGTVLDAARTPPSLSAFDTATNRLKPSVMSGFGYDTSGNLTSDPSAGIGYDAENHQTGYGASTYGYDGDGRRVKKQVGSTTTVFVYNVLGQLIAEYDNSTSPPPGSGTSYLISDHLGSTRAVMKADGSVTRHDYLPFGEETPSSFGGRGNVAGYSTADSTRQKFTQKERDNESGLDYFLARYYSSAQGRFTSVDAGRLNKRHLANPQKWNRYPYAINNPLKYIDPDGLEELIVIVNTFIPQKSTGPFKGDGRNAGEPGTYRTHQKIVIETDPSKNGGNPLVSHERDTGVSKGILPQGTTNPSFGGVVYVPKEDKASGNSLGVDVTRNESGVVNIHAHGNENNPLVPSPGITYNFDIKVNSEGPQGSAEVTVTGKHDRFPGYEIIVQRPEAENNAPQVVYDFDPRKNGNTPMSLFPLTPKEYPNKTTPIPPKPE